MTGDLTGRRQLELAIDAQEALRGVVPDDVVDAAIAALRARLHQGTDVERRRQVTVLFADVSGFTTMSEQLDSELVAGAMNRIWALLDQVVTAAGGRVDKHIGDAVMAVWGAGSTEEDDPERAVRAALSMQEAVRRRGSVDGLSIRVGVNTGPAHLGPVGTGTEYTAMGDAVNIASRIEQAAPAGGVLVTHDTYRHIRGIFDVEPLEPLHLKGKSAPVQVYVVLGEKQRRFRLRTRGVEGVETRMIGRTHEAALLQAEFARVVERAETRRVTIIGEAGIGKSRLLDDFANWIELHPVRTYFFKGRATAPRRSVTFGLLRDVVADRFDVLDSDTTAEVAGKLRRGLAPTLSPDEADVVAHWLGFELRGSAAVQSLLGSGQLAVAARAHLSHVVSALAADGPMVMFLEDLHWADEESLEVLDDLVSQCPDLHLLVVGVARPVVLERPDAADLLERSTTSIVLEPLDATTTRQLLAEILQRAEAVPAELADLVVDRADGNAFYVEELTKMLMEDGVIETGEPWERWHVHVERLHPERVPATLTGVLQARLDSLAADERDALQHASVVGRVFWDGAVDAIRRRDASSTPHALEAVRQRELVFRHESSAFGDSVEYAFKHALLRDVTYETVLLRDRRRLHDLVAGWMVERSGERVVEHAGQIAGHLRLGGDLARAADLLRRSASASLDTGNARAARRNLDEACELWVQLAEEPPVAAINELTDACLRLGDVASARRHNARARAGGGTRTERATARFLGSWIASEEGDRERERSLLDEALPDADRIGGLLLVRVLGGRAWTDVIRGDMDEARRWAQRAAEVAEPLDHPAAVREIRGLLGAIASITGDLRGSVAHCRAALAHAEAIGDLEGQALAQCNLGVGHHLIGDAEGSVAEYRTALEHYRLARALTQRLGRRLQDGMTAANMAQIQIRLGDDLAARRLLVDAFENVGTDATATLLFCILAEADRRLVLGNGDGALELLALVAAHPSRTRDNDDEIDRILGRTGRSREALPSSPEGRDLVGVAEQVVRELSADPV